ncbi:rho GTPase-activating protein gacU [Culicoides brevitarsis]|uniref:rho GTPase-activating protein gacU n=1 Tax=Culicoides brevitarsis TaxID=469753 RepID=UPI00307C1ADD
MMGLQVAASKRKYEIGACTDLNDIQPNCTPAKNPRIDEITTTITTTSTSSSTSSSSSESVTLAQDDLIISTEAIDTISTQEESNADTTSISIIQTTSTTQVVSSPDEGTKSSIPQLTGRGHELTLSKLNSNWATNADDDEQVIDPISKLQAVAVPDEAWGSESTRSTLATTLLPPDDLDEDMDDFEDDFDDDDVMLPSYGPPPQVAYHRHVPSPKGYTPQFQKYPQEQYHNQNCSRSAPTSASTYNRYGSWNNQYVNEFYHNEPMPVADPPQTIRCAENGKSYTELGTYTFFNANATRHIKRCCDGKNNWCNNKQCNKEKRIRMLNLSMFKLSRFRQASDQSLYRSVLICNTLKAIEKEIETEKRQAAQMRRQLSQIGRGSSIILNGGIRSSTPVPSQKPPVSASATPQQPEYQAGAPHAITTPEINTTNNNELQKRNEYSENNPNSTNTSSSNNLLNGSNYLQSTQQYTNHNRIYSNGFETLSAQSSPPQNSYEYHPLKDPSSGRATPFPASNGYPDTDSGYGGEDDNLSPDGQFRSINWGSVLSLSSQSALDPLNNNELFPAVPVTHAASPVSSPAPYNTCGFNSTLNNSATTTTNYLDMDLGYDVLPNCYKLKPIVCDDFYTPEALKKWMEPGSKIVCDDFYKAPDSHDNNMPDTFSTHIMVGS